MLKRECRIGKRVRVIGTAVLRDFPRCAGAVGRIDEISEDTTAGPNIICVMFRRAVCRLENGVKKGQKHLWLPPKDLEAID